MCVTSLHRRCRGSKCVWHLFGVFRNTWKTSVCRTQVRSLHSKIIHTYTHPCSLRRNAIFLLNWRLVFEVWTPSSGTQHTAHEANKRPFKMNVQQIKRFSVSFYVSNIMRNGREKRMKWEPHIKYKFGLCLWREC